MCEEKGVMYGLCGSGEGFRIECPERLCGGLYAGLWMLMNELLKLFKLCTVVQLRQSD